MNLPATTNPTALEAQQSSPMLLSTTDEVPGYQVTRVLGMVRGNTVRVRNVGVDLLAGLRSLIGGEISDYTKMLAESREQSLDRMRSHALQLGANAIVAVRFTTSTVMQGAAEILVYGTAVVLAPVSTAPPQPGPGVR